MAGRPPNLNSLDHNSAAQDHISSALDEARRCVQQENNPVKALNTVLQLLSSLGLNNEVETVTAQVKDALTLGQSPEAQLAAILGQLSLVAGACVGGAGSGGNESRISGQYQPPFIDRMNDDGNPPIDTEQQRLQQLALAAEGESYTCVRCGGVVGVARRQVHDTLWCPGLYGGGGGSMASDGDTDMGGG